jgi:hypothetical protein
MKFATRLGKWDSTNFFEKVLQGQLVRTIYSILGWQTEFAMG